MINPISYGFEKILDGFDWLYDNFCAGVPFDDWDEFVDSFHITSQEIFSGFFEFLSGSLGWINNFLFDFIFVDLISSCRFYGSQIFNYLFDTFANKPFEFVFIESVVGFTFVLFCLRLIINIIRG